VKLWKTFSSLELLVDSLIQMYWVLKVGLEHFYTMKSKTALDNFFKEGYVVCWGCGCNCSWNWKWLIRSMKFTEKCFTTKSHKQSIFTSVTVQENNSVMLSSLQVRLGFAWWRKIQLTDGWRKVYYILICLRSSPILIKWLWYNTAMLLW
jgi:hypothetical protein